mgnify:CR=1 FL=1
MRFYAIPVYARWADFSVSVIESCLNWIGQADNYAVHLW